MRETGSRLRVLIVEDYPIVRDALVQAMSLDKDIEVVGSCGTPEQALKRISPALIDVLVTNLAWREEPCGGIKLIHQVLALTPQAKVIVCSTFDDEESVRQSIQAGVHGYLLKNEADTADVVQAVKAVHSNKPVYSDTIIKVLTRLVSEAPVGRPAVHPLDRLTPREREVVPQLMDGLSNAEIAHRLGIQRKTVKTHVSHILQKLGLSSRHQVAGYVHGQCQRSQGSVGPASKT